MNTKLVFQEFRNNESIFINEISRNTKISAPTVIKIVDFLLEKGLIVEHSCVNTSVGRKPNMLKINNDKYFSIGVIYEGEYLIMGVVDLSGNILNFLQVRCGQNFENSLFSNIDKLLEMSRKDTKNLIGIGIGIPCIFNEETKEITAPLIGIENPKYFGDTIDAIASKYNAKVIVDNDLNMQAFGEFCYLKLPMTEDMIYISLGTGLGAGVIIDGKVRKGNNDICGEIGYMMFEYTEEKLNSGWLEEKINLNKIKESFGISDEAADEESKARAAEYVSKYLALIINNLIVCYDVSNIVLDGYMFELLGNDLLLEIQKRVDKICFRPIEIKRRSVVSPGILGGALLGCNLWLDEVFK
jgi:predicted NBD/HSP70 family sugar kinase